MKKDYEEGDIKITIDCDKCNGAGECVTACPVEIGRIWRIGAIIQCKHSDRRKCRRRDEDKIKKQLTAELEELR